MIIIMLLLLMLLLMLMLLLNKMFIKRVNEIIKRKRRDCDIYNNLKFIL